MAERRTRVSCGCRGFRWHRVSDDLDADALSREYAAAAASLRPHHQHSVTSCSTSDSRSLKLRRWSSMLSINDTPKFAILRKKPTHRNLAIFRSGSNTHTHAHTHTRSHARTRSHTHTHTHTLNGPLSGTTKVSRYQKGKTNLNFTEARDNEWQ